MRPIDADALVKNIESAIENGYGVTVGDVIATIEYAPTIEPNPSRDWNGWENGCGRTYDVQPKHGTWNDHTCINWHGWHCSVCDYETQRKTRYCPNCGSLMERSEDG